MKQVDVAAQGVVFTGAATERDRTLYSAVSARIVGSRVECL